MLKKFFGKDAEETQENASTISEEITIPKDRNAILKVLAERVGSLKDENISQGQAERLVKEAIMIIDILNKYTL